MRTDETPEVIEILDEESGVFGADEPTHSLPSDTSRRWIAPVAALALVALIVFGIVTSASEHAPPAAAPVTTGTTVHRTTTVPAPTSTVDPPHVPYYAAEPPREYKLISVDYQNQFFPAYDSNGFQLWAKSGSSGSDGAWFSLNYYYGPTGEAIATNAYRIDTGNGHTLVSMTAPGRIGLQIGDAAGTLDLESFGWNANDLLALAQSITVDAGVPSFSPSPLTDGYEMVSSIEPWMALEGIPVESIFYTLVGDPTSSLGLNVSMIPDMDAAEIADARQVGMRVLLDHATAFAVPGGSSGIAGQVIGGDYALATWIVDDHIVTVSARMSVPQLIEVAQSVHTVSDSEFRGMQFQATHNTSEQNSANGGRHVSNSVPLWTGTTPSGMSYSINVSMETWGSARQIDWLWALQSGGYSTPVTDAAQINTFVDTERTFVLADLPRTVAATATLVITRENADPISVPFVDTDTTLDRTFAAYAFSEDGPYTAQIVGSDGAVLASWPPA